MHLGLIGLGIGELLFFLLIAPLFLLTFVFWVWMLIDAIRNNGLSDTEKLIWVIVIVFTHFIGALIYLFVGKPKWKAAS